MDHTCLGCCGRPGAGRTTKPRTTTRKHLDVIGEDGQNYSTGEKRRQASRPEVIVVVEEIDASIAVIPSTEDLSLLV